jgi:G3E family GTPase
MKGKIPVTFLSGYLGSGVDDMRDVSDLLIEQIEFCDVLTNVIW